MWPFKKNQVVRYVPARVDAGVVQHMVNAAQRSIRKLSDAFGVQFRGRRDTNEVFGYRTEGQRDYDYYNGLYRFSGIAKRVVKGVASSCWRDGAVLRPDEDSEIVLLDAEMKKLRNVGMLTGLEEADVLNRIGNYSVMYIGLPGKPEEPVQRTPGLKFEDIYFAPYSQQSVTIAKYDVDPASSRYSQPEMYTLTPANVSSTSGATDVRQSINAHWTRVVLLNEGKLGSSINGEPTLEDIANYLEDIIKVGGGSAEAFYRNVNQKFLMDIDKEFEADFTAKDGDGKTMSDRAQDFINEFQSFIGFKGTKLSAVPVSIGDPMSTFEVAIRSISGSKQIPVRVLMGVGGGQLAGSEDKASYNQTIHERQEQICTGYLLQALGILSLTGLITLPEVFVIDWPLAGAMDEKIQSEIDLNEAKAFEAVANGIATIAGTPGADVIFTPQALLTAAGLPPEIVEQASTELKVMGTAADGDGQES